MPWKTAHKDHAIERVALSFDLAEQIPSRPWNALHERALKIALGDSFAAAPLPEERVISAGGAPIQKVFQIALNSGAVSVTSPTDGPAGKVFTKPADDGLYEQFSISKAQFSYAATRYTGWPSFERRATELLGPLLDDALALVSLLSIKLEYWDRFVFYGDGAAHYGEIFREGSKHIPGFVFEIDALWHSHSGAFLPTPHADRRLMNINLDMLDLAQPDADTKMMVNRRSAGVYTMAQDMFSSMGGPATVKSAAIGLADMHDYLKGLFGGLVTDEICKQVGLTEKN